MKQLSGWSLALSLALLAGCSGASGPTFNAYTITAADGSTLHQVECHGIFEGPATCTKVAERICHGEPVRPVQKVGRLLPDNDPADVTRRFTFACGDAPVAAASQPAAAEPPTIVQFVLQSDALFTFGQSSRASMLPGGVPGVEPPAVVKSIQPPAVESIEPFPEEQVKPVPEDSAEPPPEQSVQPAPNNERPTSAF